MIRGARKEVEQVLLHSYTILNFDVNINLGRAAFSEILMLTWEGGGGTVLL
jgi:hypothetical protein